MVIHFGAESSFFLSLWSLNVKAHLFVGPLSLWFQSKVQCHQKPVLDLLKTVPEIFFYNKKTFFPQIKKILICQVFLPPLDWSVLLVYSVRL